MKYAQQTQAALDRLDQSLMRLRDMIKRGDGSNGTVSKPDKIISLSIK